MEGISSPLKPYLERIRSAEEGGAGVDAAGLSVQLNFCIVDDDEDDDIEVCWAKLSGCRDERRG